MQLTVLNLLGQVQQKLPSAIAGVKSFHRVMPFLPLNKKCQNNEGRETPLISAMTPHITTIKNHRQPRDKFCSGHIS